jgi:membrane protein
MTAGNTNATSPWALGWPAWKDILLRSWRESSADNVGLIAAGVAFYGFLAIVPVLGAIVLSYGLVATPETVLANVKSLTGALPADAAGLIGEQLLNVVKTSDGKKGLGLLLALALALFGARNGAGAIVTALNVAYEEEEKRGFIAVNLLSLAMTAAGVVAALLAIVATAAMTALEDLLPTSSPVMVVAGKAASYLLLTLVGAAAAAALYRFGPSRARPRWTWITPGSLLCAVGWLLLTLGFGLYVANFGNYNAAYGSLGAVVVLLTWLYLSSYILLLGAELNSECEHQTARDTTTGAAQPLGSRGAWVADHLPNGAAEKPTEVAAPAPPSPSQSQSQSSRPEGTAPTLAAGVAGSRLGALLGGHHVGVLGTGLATAGLALVRGRRRAPLGFAMVAAAGALSWLRGSEPDPDQS